MATILDIFSVEACVSGEENRTETEIKMTSYEDLKSSKNWQGMLYTRYHQRVYGICLYFLKDREEARDAAHDVFIKAYRAWGDFEWKCDPLTWIGAIAKHDCFSRLQKNKKQLERRGQICLEEAIHNDGTSDEDLVLNRLKLEKILPNIRGRLKEILHLSLNKGLNQREIAVHMGVSRVAITRRLTRFKRELQQAGSNIPRKAAKKQIRDSRIVTVRAVIQSTKKESVNEREDQLRLRAA